VGCSVMVYNIFFFIKESIRQSYGSKISCLDEGIIIVEYLISYVICRLQASCMVNWFFTIPGNLH
jgi:hypothetical protein